MRKLLFCTIFVTCFANGESLQKDDLTGTWVPSGQMPRETGVRNYKLTVGSDQRAQYVPLEERNDLALNCDLKPSSSQDSIFVYYCYLGGNHLITLSLGGWVSDSAMMLYGYEYWLGDPRPGEIYGGLPVSLTRERSTETIKGTKAE